MTRSCCCQLPQRRHFPAAQCALLLTCMCVCVCLYLCAFVCVYIQLAAVSSRSAAISLPEHVLRIFAARVQLKKKLKLCRVVCVLVVMVVCERDERDTDREREREEREGERGGGGEGERASRRHGDMGLASLGLSEWYVCSNMRTHR
jgi:hypothetical protein